MNQPHDAAPECRRLQKQIRNHIHCRFQNLGEVLLTCPTTTPSGRCNCIVLRHTLTLPCGKAQTWPRRLLPNNCWPNSSAKGFSPMETCTVPVGILEINIKCWVHTIHQRRSLVQIWSWGVTVSSTILLQCTQSILNCKSFDFFNIKFDHSSYSKFCTKYHLFCCVLVY